MGRTFVLSGLDGQFVRSVAIWGNMIYTFKLDLRARTKKNHRPIFRNKKTGKVFLGKDKSLVEYENACHLILTSQKNIQGIRKPINGLVSIKYLFEFKGKRTADIDNLIAGINDPLQKAGIIENDKQIEEIYARAKENMGHDLTVIELRVSSFESPTSAVDLIRGLLKS